MALAKGVNCYATVDEAELYFEDRLDVAAWTSATPEQKAQALVTASQLLEQQKWRGRVVAIDQKMAFPREGQYYDPRLGYTVQMEGVPRRVIIATFELAYHLLNNDGLLDNAGGVDSISIGPVNLSNIKSPETIPAQVYTQIAPLLVSGGASTWWRNN